MLLQQAPPALRRPGRQLQRDTVSHVLPSSSASTGLARPGRSAVAPETPPADGLRGWWAHLPLHRQVQVMVQAFLFVILLGLQIWIGQHLKDQALHAAQQRTVSVADSVNNGLNTMMDVKIEDHDVISDPKARALFLKRMGVSDHLLELRIVRAKGLDDEYGPGLPEEQARDALDRQVLESGKTAIAQARDAQGRDTLRAVLPSIGTKLYRESRCLSCHAVDEGTVLGAVNVVVDVSEDMAAIRRIDLLLWAGQAVLQLLLFFLIGFAVRRALAPLGGEPREVVALAGAVAEGDLTRRIAVAQGDETSMVARLGHMRRSLSKVVGEVRHSAQGVALASQEIAQGNRDLSARTEQQASTLEQTSATMMELGDTAGQNAGRAQEADALAREATGVAERAGHEVGAVVATMQGISEAAHRITEIVGVIDGIAFQTNILALNASVEAARAGEQGRGFAVVAAEVRSLAGRSAAAAKEIKGLIGASVERVEQGTGQVDTAGQTMGQVVQAIHRVTALVSEISTASRDQSLGLSQVVAAIGQMDQSTQQNAAMVEEMAAAASSLESQARDLVAAMARFRLDAH
ncbi:MAG: hypothetical protein RL722_735 [Pseudomonadota bacterium]